MELSDYANAMAAAQRLVPSYDALRMNALQMQGQQLQNQQTQQEMQIKSATLQDEDAFHAAVTDLGANPTSDRIRALAIRFPKFAPGINQTVSGMEKSQRDRTVGDVSQMHAALAGNRPDLAKAIVQRHIDASKASGQEPDPSDTAVLGMLDSKDPAQLKAARGFLFATLAAADPDSAAKTIGEYSGTGTVKGQVVGRAIGHYDDAGKWTTDYRDPEPAQYRSVGPGETLVAVGGEGGGQSSGGAGASGGSGSSPFGRYTGGWTPRSRNGGDNSDAAVDSKITGAAQFLGVGPSADISGMSPMQIAKAMTLSEGGQGSLADRNNNPGNLRNTNRTYKKFPSKEAGLAAAAALVARKLKQGQTTVQSMIEGRPIGGGAPQMMGGARVVAQGAPTNQPQRMSAAEVAAEGLDGSIVYYRNKDGVPQPVGGQTRSSASLKPPPPAAQKSILENHSTLREIDRAIAAVQSRPNSFGFGTGALGDTFTQYNDPEGVASRAAVGKVGGKIIHDVSGAAVTLSEAPRFQPYVPKISDRPETIIAKLKQLRALAAGDQDDLTAAYGPDNGYRGVKLPGQKAQAAPTQVRTVADAMKLPKGTVFITPDGRRKVR